jgi:diguanylate cyclase
MSTSSRSQSQEDPGVRLPGVRWLAHVVLGALVLSYLGLLIVRRPGETSTLIDGWGVDVLEACAAVLCMFAARGRGPGRRVPLLLGFGALCWATGDITAVILTPHNLNDPAPSFADVGYLAFFPFAYVAIAMYTRVQSRRLSPAYLLDGAIAGLGAAAVCAAVVFSSIANLTHRSGLGTAVALAYPVGDVLLLLLVAGGAVIASGRRAPWLLLAIAFTINALGDTSNLLQASSSHVGAMLAFGAWPVSVVLIATAMWLRPEISTLRTAERPAGFVLPGLSACAGVVVLLLGALVHISPVATVIAAATLLAVVLRTALSVGELRTQTEVGHHQSRTDPLTGLENRRRLFDALDPFFDTAPDQRPALAFLFIDLNRFKQVNDSFGHAAGDEVLRHVAARLKQSLRPTDLVVRVGGDEFGVVLMDADSIEVEETAARIYARLAEPFTFGGITAEVGASIGVALAQDAAEATTLVANADAAMYEAKLDGHPVAFYADDLERGATRLRLADELSQAIDSDQLVLYYQPQLDLRRDGLPAVEALIRWNHPEHGLIQPVRFLPLAAEAGLMSKLTRWVIAAALHQCAQWNAAGRSLAVSVNISVEDLLDPDFPRLVTGLLNRERLGANRLTIEITETSIIDEFDRARDAVSRLRDLGIDVAVDDFGAGFTSLAYLSELAVAELKLDRRFISPLEGGAVGRESELVRATVELGHALGLRVVAEGVEDDATLELLRSLGCDLAQGYVISRPVPAAELEAAEWKYGTPLVPSAPVDRGGEVPHRLVPERSHPHQPAVERNRGHSLDLSRSALAETRQPNDPPTVD